MSIPGLEKHCQFCSVPLNLHERFSGTICSDWRCRERYLEARLMAHRERTAKTLGVPTPEKFPIAVVPSWSPRVVPVSGKKLEDFEKHLGSLIENEQVIESVVNTELMVVGPLMPAPASEEIPNIEAIATKVCGVCKGFCCFYGGTRNAFIDRESLIGFLSRNPGMTAYEAIAEYMRYIPEQHCKDSCVYQTEQGCNLPRAMRASICNNYECRGLRDAKRKVGTGETIGRYVVVRQDNHIVRSAFIDDAGISP